MLTAQLGPPPAVAGRGRWTDGESAQTGAPPDGASGFAALLLQLAGPPAETIPTVTDPLAAGPLTGELPLVTGADVAGTLTVPPPAVGTDTAAGPAPAVPSQASAVADTAEALAGPSANASPVAHAATAAAGDGGAAVRAAVHAALLARKAEGAPVPAAAAPVTPGMAPAAGGMPAATAAPTAIAAGATAVAPVPGAEAPAASAAPTTAATSATSATTTDAGTEAAAQPAAVVTVALSRRPEGGEGPRDARAIPAAESAAPRPEGAPAPIPAAVSAPTNGSTSTAPAHQTHAPAMARATNAAELAHELGARMRMAVREGGRELVVSLRPAELGHLTVRVTMVDGALTAQIAADRPEAARMLQQSLGQLGTVLSELGFQIDALDIGWTGQEQGAQAQAGQDGQPGGARADEPAPGFTLDGLPADMVPVSVASGPTTTSTTTDAVGDDGLDLLA